MRQFKGDTGHIFNLGHGITPDVQYTACLASFDTPLPLVYITPRLYCAPVFSCAAAF
jgi:hypothetical protein